MKTIALLFFVVGIYFFGYSQQNGYYKSEIGAELYAGFSNLGGAFGGEIKYAYLVDKNLAVGPSFRLQRTWTNNLGINNSFNIYGGGAFAHYRLQEKLFLGAEIQLFKSPFNFISFQPILKPWALVALVGGGAHLKLHERIRLSAGIFYDIVNAENSPFRSSYNFKIKDQTGQTVRYLPIIYRVTFFFPLGEKVN
ncbi:MAG: hypothetical protein FJZ67_07420 [Bacteroidetes bacterium]|nr:hypothetical protein [Bacteroidota bacterium]